MLSQTLHHRLRRSDQRVLKADLSVELNDRRPQNISARVDRDDQSGLAQTSKIPICGTDGQTQLRRGIFHGLFWIIEGKQSEHSKNSI